MKFLFSSLLTFLFSGLHLSAQEPADSKPKAPTGRLVWFVAASLPDNLENPVSVMTGTDIKPITLSKRMASEPVKIPADGIIKIVRKVPNPADSAKPTYLTLAQAVIPEGMAKAMIILAPAAPKEGSSLVFQTKIQDLAGFKGGDYLYLNLTSLNMAVQLGDKKLGIKPGETTIYDAGGLAAATEMPVSYYSFDPEDKKWKMLTASTIIVQPTRREIC